MQNDQKELLKYTTSSILAMIAVSVYVLADTYFISLVLGTVGLTALNFSIVVFTLIQSVGLMIAIGSAIDHSVRKRYALSMSNYSFISAVWMGLLFALLFIFAGVFYTDKIAIFLGATNRTLLPTQIYIKTILMFSPFFISNHIILAFVRNDRNPRLAMLAMVISSFSNIILDYVFLFPFGLGMFGAALATGLSPIISMSLLSIHFIDNRLSYRGYQFCKEIKKSFQILVFGLPSLITELATSVALYAFNSVLLKTDGITGVAAYGVIANTAIIATALHTGIAQGIQPLTSYRYAKSDRIGLRVLLHRSLAASVSLSVLMYVFIFIFTRGIASAFNAENNTALAALAEAGLRIYFIGFVFAGINILMTSYLASTAHTKDALAISVLRSSGLLIPILLILSTFFGSHGIWASFAVAEFVVMIVSFVLYFRRLKTDHLISDKQLNQNNI